MAVRIIHGDCREVLPTLAAESFDCVVTSPPYFGLRDYGVAGQIGLEPTMNEYLETMVDVCRELRRVLKPSGTFWLNVGDSYAASLSNNGGYSAKSTLAGFTNANTKGRQANNAGSAIKIDSGLPSKNLCMVPNRLAIMLQADGWYVRSEIIWAKPNPMPESVTDRPTSAHEKIWLLTKSAKYFYDADAIAEPNITGQCKGGDINYRPGTNGNQCKDLGRTQANERDTRNARNVWTIASQPYSGAHFATFPPALAERCIKAGCPIGGHVLDPFSGAGTTAMTADRLGRHATGIELNPEYANLGMDRIRDDAGMFAEISA